ncbi:HpcH/HpaI aldolase family protein [Miniphocaeibacter massiliensis]|uniref:HpcH/HpaI aldolase family protein n=1 Tax=Miniphocaeibacter massiliensis TaxID=2041841 RepID=UPI000C1C53C6|nr:aldolase/citrate lyase family protein [Miniphocaeibacter massiliensis]
MNEKLLKIFKEKISKEPVLGMFMKSSDPAFIEAAGYSGLDYLILDMEHGPVNIQKMQNNIRAAQVSNTLPIIRVGSLDEHTIGQVLDIGAAGIQIPHVNNANSIKKIIEFSRFYPSGHRGICRFVRAAEYSSKNQSTYFKDSSENLIIVQLEGVEALNNLEEILDVSGIDIYFIGPYDLSQSLGVPGEISNPKVLDTIKYIVDKANNKGAVVGTFIDSLDSLHFWKNLGIKYLAYSVDVGIFVDSCKRLVNEFNKIK